MRTNATPALLLALAVGAVLLPAALAAPPDSRSGGVTVSRLSGGTLEARALTAIRGGRLVLDVAGRAQEVPVEDVIEISLGTDPDGPRELDPNDVAVDLWSGEELLGRISTGDDREITLATPLLGDVKVPVDDIAGVRFLERLAKEAELPDLRSRDDGDVVHLVGGDRIECTLTALLGEKLTCATEARDEVAVPYGRVTALRLMQAEPKRAQGTALVVVLRDGTRVLGTKPRVERGRLIVKSVSGFDASAELTDVVAAHAMSDAFRYLSDLPPAEVKIEPFWTPVAGDPHVLYAPRMDRSFGGRRLRVGGRTWLKGVGVFAGTTLTWKLDKRYSEFRTHVGLDDGAGELGGVVFQVLVDGKERFDSGFVRPASTAADDQERRGRAGPVDAGRIDVKGASTLTLRVLAGDDEDPYPIQDEADWLGAMLVR